MVCFNSGADTSKYGNRSSEISGSNPLIWRFYLTWMNKITSVGDKQVNLHMRSLILTYGMTL